LALHHVLDRAPDLVASGINYGANLGPDLMYSGTVGAAREAAQAGHAAIAFSLASGVSGLTFEAQAKVAARMCILFLEEQVFKPQELINVNFPVDVTDATPWSVCTLGQRRYSREVTRQMDPRGKPYYWVGGKFLGHDDIPGSDCNAIDEGLISITPVCLQAVSTPSFTRLSTLVEETTSSPSSEQS
ncbi:MAG: 5'/3'-nucleotidase SurE, partial [Myxococcota bacterium]